MGKQEWILECLLHTSQGTMSGCQADLKLLLNPGTVSTINPRRKKPGKAQEGGGRPLRKGHWGRALNEEEAAPLVPGQHRREGPAGARPEPGRNLALAEPGPAGAEPQGRRAGVSLAGPQGPFRAALVALPRSLEFVLSKE